MRTVAVEVTPLNPETQARVTLRFTDRDHARATVLNGERCWPGIMRNLALNREGWNGDWVNNIAPPQVALDISLGALRKADPGSPVYRWAGAAMRVFAGEIGALGLLFEGLVDETVIREGTLKITGRVDDEPFIGDLLSEKYDGRGLAGGGEDLAEKPKPACFGYCRNLEAVQINVPETVYQVHGYGPIEEIVAVFERGIDFGVSVGDFPTYDALLAASVPEGRWGTCLALGLFRMGAPPAGVLTCDVKGDNTGGFHQTTAAIIRRVLEIAAVPGDRIDEDSLDAFEAAVPYPINVYVTTQESPLALIGRLALPCNAQASFSWAGKLQVSRFADMPVPTMQLSAAGEALPAVLDTAEQPVSAPMWRIEMQYARAWRPQSKNEIALEEDLPEPMPVTVWGRFPTQPPRPTGNGIPGGWSPVRPLYELPTVNLNDPTADEPEYTHDVVLTAGPIWRSGAMQRDGETTTDGWDYPTLDDPNNQPFRLATMNEESMVLLGTNGLATQPQYGWFGAGGDNNEGTAFIPDGINGPFNLSWRVRNGDAMFVAGIINYDPRTMPTYQYLDPEEIFCGVMVANNNDYYVQRESQGPPPYYLTIRDPVTGVYPFNEQDMTGGYFDETINASSNSLPDDDTLYQMTFDGHLFDIYVGGVHVRTYGHNMEVWDSTGFWPVFSLLDARAEIYDIAWEPGELGQRNGVPMGYSFGAMRYQPGPRQWELYSANDEFEGFGYGYADTRVFKGECILSFETNIPGGDSPPDPSPGFSQFCYLYDQSNLQASVGFRFKSNGQFGYINESQSTPTAPFSSGDKFSAEIRDRVARYFHNGELTREHLVRPGRFYTGYFELGKNGYFRRFGVQTYGTNNTVQGSVVEAATWANVVDQDDATIIAAGNPGYFLIAELPDLNFTVADFVNPGGLGTSNSDGLVRVAAALTFRATIGFVALQLEIQVSTNGGASWSNVVNSANPNDSETNFSDGPTDRCKMSLTTTQSGMGGTQSRRYRLLATRYNYSDLWEISIEDFTMTADFSQ